MRTIIGLSDCPELCDKAAQWFSEKWGYPVGLYRESMAETAQDKAVPQWYVCIEDGCIIGGAGVINNDFHKRRELSPNICAVYVDEAHRGHGIAGALLRHVCRDMHEKGIDTLYLVTDHVGFYERYGWEYFTDVEEDSGEISRLYRHIFTDKAGIDI